MTSDSINPFPVDVAVAKKPAGAASLFVSPLDERSLRYLLIAIRILLVGSVVMLVVQALLAPQQPLRAVGPAMLVPLAAAILWLVGRDRVPAALRTLVVGSWLVLAVATTVNGGFRSPGVLAYPVIVIMAGWIVSDRQALALTVLTVALSGAWVAAERAGAMPQPPYPPSAWTWIAFSVILAIAASLAFMIASRHVHRYESAAQQSAGLEARVRERTTELLAANKELESFAYSISHDLRSPLRGIDGFSQLLLDDYGPQLDEQGREYIGRVRRAAQRMGVLIDDLLELSRVTRQPICYETVDLGALARELIDDLRLAEPGRRVDVLIRPRCPARGDPQLLRVLLQNLLGNAWKYTSRAERARIEVGLETSNGETAYYVRDNGAGFDMTHAARLFLPFQRLHRPDEFEGSGIGLASAAGIARRHGGRIWAESAVGQGAVFRFTLEPQRPSPSDSSSA